MRFGLPSIVFLIPWARHAYFRACADPFKGPPSSIAVFDPMTPPRSTSKPALVLSWLMGWVGTPVYLLCFGITVLLFDPILRLVYRWRGYDAHQQGIRVMNLLLYQSLWVNGCRVSWKPNAHRPDPAYRGITRIFVANHQSLNDIPPLIWKLRAFRPVLVSKAELASGVPSISYNFVTGGVIALQRKNPNQSLAAMRRLGQRIQSSGESVLYFPEGTRSRQGQVGTFKSGGLEQIMHHVTNIELIPIAVQRSWELARWKFLPLPFGVTLHFEMLPTLRSVDFEGPTDQKARAMMQAAHRLIQENLHQN